MQRKMKYNNYDFFWWEGALGPCFKYVYVLEVKNQVAVWVESGLFISSDLTIMNMTYHRANTLFVAPEAPRSLNQLIFEDRSFDNCETDDVHM